MLQRAERVQCSFVFFVKQQIYRAPKYCRLASSLMMPLVLLGTSYLVRKASLPNKNILPIGQRLLHMRSVFAIYKNKLKVAYEADV